MCSQAHSFASTSVSFRMLENGMTTVVNAHISFSERPKDLTECLCSPKSPLGSCAPPYLMWGNMEKVEHCSAAWDSHVYAALLPLSCPMHARRTACGTSFSPAKRVKQSVEACARPADCTLIKHNTHVPPVCCALLLAPVCLYKGVLLCASTAVLASQSDMFSSPFQMGSFTLAAITGCFP